MRTHAASNSAAGLGIITLLVLGLLSLTSGLAEEDDDEIKFPSPDGRYALRIHESESHVEESKVVLIEKSTGSVAIDFETSYPGQVEETVLAWSADSKWLACGTRGTKEGKTKVYVRQDATFEELSLPDNLPVPKIHLGKKAAVGGVKNYGGALQPLRWLKPGQLELSNDLMMLSHVDGKSYTGVVRFTVIFDAKQRASLHMVGKTKTSSD